MSALIQKRISFQYAMMGVTLKTKPVHYVKDNVRTCNKLTGRCDNGCDNYRTGEFCQGQFKIPLMFSLR